jgi:2-keto-4-pentenoate hydratase/2-oxohepta-3-ene-1,7-dioic acid hydratase in catechol pathway
MKLVNYRAGQEARAGVFIRGRVYDVAQVSGYEHVRSIDELLSAGKLEILEERAGELSDGIDLEKVSLLPPVSWPDKILLAAVNYRAHGKEQGAPPPKEPYFFTKFRSCLIADGEPILIPSVSRKVDWEVELAFVIGKKGKYIGREAAMEHVAGYTVANDISFRDLQFPEGWPDRPNTLGQNWVKGKALDSALPLGPWLVTRSEVEDPQDLRLWLTVNGTRRQDGTTSDMVFGVDRLVEYLSDGITLLPGDVISTGTPSGVAVFSGAPFLKDGDIVEASVERVGRLRNPVMQERRQPRTL